MADAHILAGRYRVGPVVVESAYSVVCAGEELESGREVAIKFHRAEYLAQPAVRARFLREARALEALAHPNLVRIYASGEDEGRAYLVMQRVRGQTLAERLAAGGRLPLAEVTRLGVEALDALAVLHGSGFIHRDVKPANLMLTAEGRCVVLDFGILRAADDVLAARGLVEGTPEYISPEQSRDVRLTDARSDLYSLGATIYAALTGAPPFTGRDPNTIFHKHHTERPVPLSRLVAGLPHAADEFMQKALAKKPEGRFQTALEMRAALLHLSRTSTP